MDNKLSNTDDLECISALQKENARLKQENARKQSKIQLYEKLFNHLPFMLWVKNPVGKYLLANTHYSDATGYAVEKIIGKSDNELFSKEIAEKNQNEEQLIAKIKNGICYEENNNTSNLCKWLEINKIPILDPDNNLSGIIGVIKDITRNKRSELSLKDSETKYKRIFENYLDVFYEISLDGRIIEISPSIEKMSKYKRSELIGSSIYNIYEVPNQRDGFLLKIQNKGKVTDYEVQLKDKDGTIKFVSFNAKMLYNDNKRPVKVVGTLRDITGKIREQEKPVNEFKQQEMKESQNDVKKAGKELLDEKKMLQVFMNNIVDNVYFKDKKSRFIRVNKAWLESRGMPKFKDCKSVTGKNDYDFFSPEIARQTYNEEQEIIKTGKSLISRTEKRKNVKTGKYEWISTTKMPFMDENGEITGTFGISRNITEQKKAEHALLESEQKLRELNAAKDKFFSIVAHDLKGPFSNLIGFAELLRAKFDTYTIEKIKYFTNLIYESAQLIYDLLETLLDWSRWQSGRIQYKPEYIDLHKICQPNIELMNKIASRKIIKIYSNIQENTIVFADPYMTNTIIRNLLSNALKYTDKEGKIILNSKINSQAIEVSVCDTGRGITNENLEKLFGAGTSFSTKGTDNETGTGLGLILCKEFIDRNKGYIRAESIEGRGSKFVFSLPRYEHNV